MKTILHINDCDILKKQLMTWLVSENYKVYTQSGFESMSFQKKIDLVICAVNYGVKYSYVEILKLVKKKYFNVPIIFITNKIRLCKAIELAKNGAYTCLEKPIYQNEFIAIVKKAINDKLTKNERKEKPLRYIKGSSKIAVDMFNQIELVKNTSFNVIIYGETGTGKEFVAQMLANSNNKPFIAIDCGCLTEELARSELFGHEKGSFTGATQRKLGAFELANHGTLFLDEIGNLSVEVQRYLLRAIQENKITRVGGNKSISIKTRLIVASNVNLKEACIKGNFREDLYHRLNQFQIEIPPLRNRKEDLEEFVQHFLERTNYELNKNVIGVESKTMHQLKEYAWPGNIRELRNIIRKAVLLAPNEGYIESQHLTIEHNYINELNLISNHNKSIENKIKEQNFNLQDVALHAEINKILEALKLSNNNKSKAAKILGINRKTLYNKLKEFDIKL